MDRRSFIRTAGVGAAATGLAAPAIAQGRKAMVMVSTWPRDFPCLGTGARSIDKFWDSLTDHERMLITAAVQAEHVRIASEFNANNSLYLDKLINENGVQLKRFNEEICDAFGEASQEVFEEIVGHSDLARRVHESFLEARQQVGSWLNIADIAYLRQRNRVIGVE